MANLMNKTKAQLVERINALEVERKALKVERSALKLNVELEDRTKESLKLRVKELNALLDVKNKGIEEQAEMIVKLNNELEVYKDSLFTANNSVDDYICKLNIAHNKNEYEKSLHKYYAIGGIFTGIVLYFLLTLLF